MIKSRYTFTTEKPESGELLIVNYLTGAIDLIEPLERPEFEKRFSEDNWADYPLAAYMKERGYLYADQDKEQEMIQSKYKEFALEHEKTPVQIIFSTTLQCNFACKYCFQEEYNHYKDALNPVIIDQFFSYINKKFAAEPVKPYITLFGGEALIWAESYRRNLMYLLEQSRDFGYSIAMVTNGYELLNYVPWFKENRIVVREIQVTLDGDRTSHDARRVTRGNQGTFDRIADGIDLALRNGYRINLRSIIDKDNMEALPRLAEYCNNRGWLDYPRHLFDTALGRNYELHTCQNTNKLYERLEMWQEFVALARQYPILKKYHRPQMHGMRFLYENGELPPPIFDACPAAKKEWAFDVRGNVYGCTASVGVDRYKLGSFTNPAEPVNVEQIRQWQSRDVLTMKACRTCAVSLSCGGGCGVLANNYNGSIHERNCRPVKELVGLGADYYGIG